VRYSGDVEPIIPTHTFGFSSSGPVFNLPDGYTVNSVSGNIVDNHYVGVLAGDYNDNGIVDAADYTVCAMASAPPIFNPTMTSGNPTSATTPAAVQVPVRMPVFPSRQLCSC
jgi:hypothetical protein